MRIARPCLVALLFLAIIVGQRSAHAFVRHTVDDKELADVRAATPAAAEAYVAAEARLRSGDLPGAEQLLAKANQLHPLSFLLARRHCQVLTELGRRDEAIKECLVAMSGMTAMDSRAYVGALMSGKGLAKPKDLVDAMREAANAHRLPGQPFGDAAACDIAQHIGDEALYTSCLQGLTTSAPGYFETVRWSDARGGTPAWLYLLGWGLLGALALWLLVQAFLRWFRSPSPGARRSGAVTVLILLLGTCVTAPARAEEPAPAQQQHFQLSQFPINYDNPEANIPTVEQRNSNALEFGYFLQDLAAEALRAERKGEYAKALKFWRASAKAVPDEAVGFSHACRMYQLLQQRENAIQYCSFALNQHGAKPEDYLRWSELMVSGPNPLTAPEVQDMDAAVAHLRTDPNGATTAAVVECELGVKLDDEKRLANCTSELAKTNAKDLHTLTFEWSLAMKRRDYSEARRLLAAMQAEKMEPAGFAQLKEATAAAAAWWRRPFTDLRYGAALALLFVIAGLFVFRKRAQLRAGVPAPAAE